MRSRTPRVLVMVLAGGEGKRLAPLTADRAKPAVPFAGSYRLIDFVLSNFANAGYLKIVVLTQYKSHSLDRHISLTWRFSTLLQNYVTPVPAQMRRGPYWFTGSADAIYQNLNLVSDERPDYICVFGADHIYRMDPRDMVDAHIESGAGVTVAAIPVPIEQASEFGIIEAGADGKLVRFHEKPTNPPAMAGDPTHALASMGNYVFSRDTLVAAVTPTGDDDKPTDIGGDVIPALAAAGVAHVYDFMRNDVPGQDPSERGYWRDVGTIDSYFAATMDLVAPLPAFNLYNSSWPVHTHLPSLPPAKVSPGTDGHPGAVTSSLLCQGSLVCGGHVDRSIVGPGSVVGDRAMVDETVLFPDVIVGNGARLRRCVIDKNVVIPAGFEIGFDHDRDRSHFTVSDGGVVVVAKGRDLSRGG